MISNGWQNANCWLAGGDRSFNQSIDREEAEAEAESNRETKLFKFVSWKRLPNKRLKQDWSERANEASYYFIISKLHHVKSEIAAYISALVEPSRAELSRAELSCQQIPRKYEF